jgi:hypothetical protein
MDSTRAESMNDNINMDSTRAGSMNDNINMDRSDSKASTYIITSIAPRTTGLAVILVKEVSRPSKRTFFYI